MSIVQKGGWATWCGKKKQTFRVRETEVRISPLKLITLMIWGKSFSTGSGILPPIHLGGGVWIIPITGGRYWQLVGGVMDVKCPAKDSRVQFNQELFHPRCQQRSPLGTLHPQFQLSE